MEVDDLIRADDDLCCDLCGGESDGTGMSMYDSERFEICDDCDTLMHFCLASSSSAKN